MLRAERIVIAVGTVPARLGAVAFDGATILDPEGIVHLGRVPRTLTVIGAGPVGLEYASIAAALGLRVTVVDRKPRLLEYVDTDLVEALRYHMQGVGVVFRLGEEVQAIARVADGRAVSHLANGEQLASEAVLFTAGRRGATDELRLATAGLDADDRGRIRVDSELRTTQPHIFAAGDVLGHPNLAATAIQQGRDAALVAFGHRPTSRKTAPPHAIYTIPELSFVGAGEPELNQAGVPYVAGVAEYRHLPSAQIAGDRSGRLKLLIHATTRTVLGVHIFGAAATELVHIGQTVIASDLTVDYLIDAGFNLPTFSSAYTVAALDAAARMPSARSNGFRPGGPAKSPMRAEALLATVTA